MPDRPLRVVIAPDSFKGSIAASAAASAVAAGWRRRRPQDELLLAPMADGGEGTLDALAGAVLGARRMPVTVTGPDGRAVVAAWLLLPAGPGTPGGTAVVELASTSGITLLEHPAPFDAHTIGFGEAIRAALAAGVSRLLLAIGGSASTDLGAGALSALGARFLDADGRPVPPGNRGLADVRTVDRSSLLPLPAAGALVLTDVRSPLLGPEGAAAVFGPQKGAAATDVPALEAALAAGAAALGIDPALPGAGAAGGTGAGLTAWGAELTPGAPAVAEALGLPSRVAHADLVVTGEGRFDEQSATGKVTGYVRHLAGVAGVPVALVCGELGAPPSGFAAAVSLQDLAPDRTAAMADAGRWLAEAGAELGRRLDTDRWGGAAG
ncbi:MAG: glycerate kinase [Amnibacterium sp.]